MAQPYNATGGRSIGAGPDPPDVNRVGLMGIYPRNDRDATLPLRQAVEQGDDVLKQFVARHYKGARRETDEIVKGMIEAGDFYANEIVQVKIPSLYQRRFVLVSEVGCASGSTSTSTNLAMAGACVLLGEVGKHKVNLAAVVRVYEEQMRPIIDDLQSIPPLIPKIFAPETAWGVWLRNDIYSEILLWRLCQYH